MRLDTEQNSLIYSSVIGTTIPFDIGDPAIIIDIIREKIYSHPLQTMVQEYLSNAKDACLEAGKDSSHIDVVLPTVLNPVFIIRDYGVGMSDERVKEVFVRYGISTKRTDNNQLGCFGIGSKSGWAYCDSFIVESFYNGSHREYIADIGSNKEGRLLLFKETPTVEPNGVLIKIPVEQKDLNDFIYAFVRATFLWANKPKVLIRMEYPKLLFSIGSVSIYQAFTRDRKRNFMPGVYFNANDIPYHYEKKLQRFCDYWNVAFVIKSNPLKLQISANREGFSNSEYARRKVIKAFEEVEKYILKRYEECNVKDYLKVFRELDMLNELDESINFFKNKCYSFIRSSSVISLKRCYTLNIKYGNDRKVSIRNRVDIEYSKNIYLSKSQGKKDSSLKKEKLPEILLATQQAITNAKKHEYFTNEINTIIFQGDASDEEYAEVAQVLNATQYIEDVFNNKIEKPPEKEKIVIKEEKFIVHKFRPPQKGYSHDCRRDKKFYYIDELKKYFVVFYGHSCSLTYYKIIVSLINNAFVGHVPKKTLNIIETEKYPGFYPIVCLDKYLLDNKELLYECNELFYIKKYSSMCDLLTENSKILKSTKFNIESIASRIAEIEKKFDLKYNDSIANTFFRDICEQAGVESIIDKFAKNYPLLTKVSHYDTTDEMLEHINIYLQARDVEQKKDET